MRGWRFTSCHFRCRVPNCAKLGIAAIRRHGGWSGCGRRSRISSPNWMTGPIRCLTAIRGQMQSLAALTRFDRSQVANFAWAGDLPIRLPAVCCNCSSRAARETSRNTPASNGKDCEGSRLSWPGRCAPHNKIDRQQDLLRRLVGKHHLYGAPSFPDNIMQDGRQWRRGLCPFRRAVETHN